MNTLDSFTKKRRHAHYLDPATQVILLRNRVGRDQLLDRTRQQTRFALLIQHAVRYRCIDLLRPTGLQDFRRRRLCATGRGHVVRDNTGLAFHFSHQMTASDAVPA